MKLLHSIRVGNELGAGHPKVARLSVLVVVTASITFSILATVTVLVLRYPLSTLYTSSTTVIEAVISLTPLLAISIFLNGIQPILSGTLGTEIIEFLVCIEPKELTSVLLFSQESLSGVGGKS
jgi:hypothetical protein